MNSRWRATLVLVVLWLLYQSAEGVGARWLHSGAVQSVLMLACVLIAWPLSRWLGYRGYGAYALGGGPGLRWWLPAGLVIATAAKFAATLIGLRMGIYVPDATTPALAGAMLLAALPMFLLSTFVPSLAEDILARGFWYRTANIRWRSGVVFVLASSAIYVLNHIYRLGNGPMQWLVLFCFGMTYAAALWRSGSLWAAVGLHWGWNLATIWSMRCCLRRWCTKRSLPCFRSRHICSCCCGCWPCRLPERAWMGRSSRWIALAVPPPVETVDLRHASLQHGQRVNREAADGQRIITIMVLGLKET